MKNQKHTAEPWEDNSINDEVPILGGDGLPVLQSRGEESYIDTYPEDIKRIVQCVNAMAGIEDPQAFMDVVRHIISWANNVEEREITLNPKRKGSRYSNKLREALDLFPKESEKS